MRILTWKALLSVALLSNVAFAQTAVTLNTAGTTNTNFNTGFTFSNTSTIRITDLGKWDINGGGLAASSAVAIYNRTSGQIVATTVPTSAPAEANGVRNAHYASITPVVLLPGHYAVATQYANEPFAFDNAITTGSAIKWHEGIAGASGALPADISGFTITRPNPSAYFGANFKYEVVAGPTMIPIVSYAYDGSGAGAIPSTSPAFPDTGGTELINGLFPATTNFNDVQWVGFQDPDPDDGTSHPRITFNLGTIQDLASATISYLHSTTQAGGTITAPDSVLVSFSNDGSLFTTPISFSSQFDSSAGDDIRSATLDLTGNSGRFVRLDFRNASPWTFLTEVSFNAVAVAVPEATSLALWGWICFTLPLIMVYRRYRRGRSPLV
jgi:hypothetical protein